MQVPMIVVLNMLDMAAAHQIEIDPHKLSEALGCAAGLYGENSLGE